MLLLLLMLMLLLMMMTQEFESAFTFRLLPQNHVSGRLCLELLPLVPPTLKSLSPPGGNIQCS